MRILCGDCIEILRTLPDESMYCCVTSPPYWGLRDYGHAGQLGLEKTPEEYVGKLVEIFREVRRVLRKDGTCWLNLGDSYAAILRSGRKESPGVGAKQEIGRVRTAVKWHSGDGSKFQWTLPGGQKPKDLCGIPWRVAFALQADGWWLRQDIIWAKSNPMPEFVRDRCTKAHEYVFLLTKSARYFYNAEAIKEESLSPWAATDMLSKSNGKNDQMAAENPDLYRTRGRNSFHSDEIKTKSNKRSVWTIATQPYPEAHFATFPEELPRLCILAGCPVGGTVLDPFCGAGTTGLVAKKLGHDFIGIELNPDYVEMATRRINSIPKNLFCEVTA